MHNQLPNSTKLTSLAAVVLLGCLIDWLAYGGSLSRSANQMSIIPRDGLRQRFYAVLGDQRLKIELDRDGFAANRALVTDTSLTRVRFTLENRIADSHTTLLKFSPKGKTQYAVLLDTKRIAVAKPDAESVIEIRMSRPLTTIDIVKVAAGNESHF